MAKKQSPGDGEHRSQVQLEARQEQRTQGSALGLMPSLTGWRMRQAELRPCLILTFWCPLSRGTWTGPIAQQERHGAKQGAVQSPGVGRTSPQHQDMLESSSGKGARALGGHQAKHGTNQGAGSTRSMVDEGADPSPQHCQGHSWQRRWWSCHPWTWSWATPVALLEQLGRTRAPEVPSLLHPWQVAVTGGPGQGRPCGAQALGISALTISYSPDS